MLLWTPLTDTSGDDAESNVRELARNEHAPSVRRGPDVNLRPRAGFCQPEGR
jgi:hypothetical protein